LENAYSDLQEDSINLPGRVRLVEQIGHRNLGWATVALNALMLVAAALLGAYTLVFMALALLLVHQYSFRPLRAKARPVAGLLVFALVVTYPFFVGTLIDPEASFLRGLGGGGFESRRFWGMLFFITLWFVAKGMFKNIPDYHGDRAAGLTTSATVFGSRLRAARACAVMTVAAYGSLAALVLTGYERPRVAFALVWFVPAIGNAWRLIRDEDPLRANDYLKTDMVLSACFMASLLLLIAPGWPSVVTIGLGLAILLASDLLQVDSRRSLDVGVTHEAR